MDGNGRWAKMRGLPREAGHTAGASNFKTVVRYCKKIGIQCCTVYAFSTENIKRPKHEVEAIFRLLLSYLEEAAVEKDIEGINTLKIATKNLFWLATLIEEEKQKMQMKNA